MNTLSKNLKFYREFRGMSKALLAENAGIHRALLTNYEQGKSEPSIRTLRKILIVLDLNFEDLVKS